ncbi:MAG: ABC transporter ATP-binding protein [Pseudomonadota bacterium]
MSKWEIDVVLTVSNLAKQFAGAASPVFSDVCFTLDAGHSVALTGESGSGKSTLLHLVAGLDHPSAGEIEIDQTGLSKLAEPELARLRRDHIGIVFQQFNLIPSLTVAANLSFQARLADRYDPDWAAALTEQLGLTDLVSRYPEELSGGQQQRVAIGRALAGKPKLILADEPTGNLDEATGDSVMASFHRLVSETDAALLMVTHSERLASKLQHRLHLSRGRLS